MVSAAADLAISADAQHKKNVSPHRCACAVLRLCERREEGVTGGRERGTRDREKERVALRISTQLRVLSCPPTYVMFAEMCR